MTVYANLVTVNLNMFKELIIIILAATVVAFRSRCCWPHLQRNFSAKAFFEELMDHLHYLMARPALK